MAGSGTCEAVVKVIVDGNDGTGKSTLVGAIRHLGYNVEDRGNATRMTDDDSVEPEEDAVYLILDVPVEVSRARLLAAGKDLTEQYHTDEDLTHYRARFLEVAARLPRCVVIDATQAREKILSQSLVAMSTFGSPADFRKK